MTTDQTAARQSIADLARLLADGQWAASAPQHRALHRAVDGEMEDVELAAGPDATIAEAARTTTVTAEHADAGIAVLHSRWADVATQLDAWDADPRDHRNEFLNGLLGGGWDDLPAIPLSDLGSDIYVTWPCASREWRSAVGQLTVAIDYYASREWTASLHASTLGLNAVGRATDKATA
ncbi:hypothetical protein [Embleya sp. NPDC005971]|uniref:hypothetical protein n=1 Tax=Embleya sp. NPDC005971 TaxID=3156724 RepID=UPI0034070A2C